MEITSIIRAIKTSACALCFLTLFQPSCQQSLVREANQSSTNRNSGIDNIKDANKIEGLREKSRNQDINYRQNCWSTRNGALFIFGKTKLFHQIFKDTLPESYQKSWGKNEKTRIYSYNYKELWQREGKNGSEFLIEAGENQKGFYIKTYNFLSYDGFDETAQTNKLLFATYDSLEEFEKDYADGQINNYDLLYQNKDCPKDKLEQ